MESSAIRRKFLEFFQSRGHTAVSSSSLIPDDPSVLLTTAGMQQFKKYYTGEADPMKDFGSLNTVSVQKSFRTSDIDEVGDDSHLTFFEMMGNFSFGGYFKKEAITWAHEFVTKELGIPISFVTIFRGSETVKKDEESRAVWRELGVEEVREEGVEDNFWGPTGSSGPCGPTTEIYCANAAGGKVEVWNLVFNEFLFPGSREELLSGTSDKKLDPLKTPGVDTGMGLERLAMIAQNKKNIFETDLFVPIMREAVIRSAGYDTDRMRRIIADHIRASVFLIADGVHPSNKGAGYILRRLLRRMIIGGVNDTELASAVIQNYKDFYHELDKETVIPVIVDESSKFSRTLRRGLNELEKMDQVDASTAFHLYQSFGLPLEVIKDFRGGAKAKDLKREDFDEEFRKHQEISRAGQERKFGGHGLLLDTGELKAKDEQELKIVTRLHTATHLLNAALREVLGPEIEQQGSDITVERTRFDFSFPRKLTPEEIKKIEEWVNNIIQRDLIVEYKERLYEEALNSGTIHFWREKYPPRVKVYTVFDPRSGEVFSQELCGGPHVTHTGEIGRFKIVKEESSSAGIRRIRAVIDT